MKQKTKIDKKDKVCTIKKYSVSEHGIVKNNIPKRVAEILIKLNESGYDSYLVGGCLRDILRGFPPKDFDVVTNATPEQVKSLFRNCRLIGRRFRLAHIYFGRDIIEVATFRADEKGDANADGQVTDHNNFGTIETDAMRRDFSINSLYYDIRDESIIDFTNAIEDVDKGIIKIIGDAKERYTEDPVRILRALRFAAKLGMRIEAETERAISSQKKLLKNIPHARLFDETIKLFLSGHALSSYEELKIHEVFGELYPQVNIVLNNFDSCLVKHYRKLVKLALKNTDQRIKQGDPVTIAFLYAVFYWPVYQNIYQKKIDLGEHWYGAMFEAMDEVFLDASKSLMIPARHKTMVRDIWSMQSRLLTVANKRKVESILRHKRFRAGFDFLELRLRSGEKLEKQYKFWVQAQIDMPEMVYSNIRHRKRHSYKK